MEGQGQERVSGQGLLKWCEEEDRATGGWRKAETLSAQGMSVPAHRYQRLSPDDQWWLRVCSRGISFREPLTTMRISCYMNCEIKDRALSEKEYPWFSSPANSQVSLCLRTWDLYICIQGLGAVRCVAAHKSFFGLRSGHLSSHHFLACNGTSWSEVVVCGRLQKWLQIILLPLFTLLKCDL